VGLPETTDSGNLSSLPLFLIPVKLSFILAVLLLGTPQSASDQPYELKGEAPGMMLKQFKSNHKHADCTKQSETLVHCHIWNDVSFGGVEAMTFKGCPTLECIYQGIFADFVDGRMIRLRYAVSAGSASKIIAALKTKYGEPTKSTENPNLRGSQSGATWKNSVGSLTVTDFWDQKQPLNSYTSVTSALNDAGEVKDI
jgi:hypothetical protein